MKKHLFLTTALLCIGYFSMAQTYHWPLTSDLNDVVSSKNGTNYGVTFQTDDERGDVAYFDGNSYAILPSFLDSLTEVTVAVWFRMDESNGWAMIYAFGSGYLTDPRHGIMVCPVMGDGTERFKTVVADATAGGNWYDLPLETDVAKIETNTWYYSTVVIKPDSIAYYLNDEQVYSAGDSPWNLQGLTDTSNYLGVSYWSDPLWNGALSDLRVYNTALSKAEVEALYQSTLATINAVEDATVNSPVVYAREGQIIINTDKPATDQVVSVYNLSGSMIARESLKNIGNNIFNPGLYIVQIKGSETNYSTKVLVK